MRGLNDGDTMAPNDEASFWLANDSNKQTRFTRETFHVSLKVRMITRSKACLGIFHHNGFGPFKDRILIEKLPVKVIYSLLEQQSFNRQVKNFVGSFI